MCLKTFCCLQHPTAPLGWSWVSNSPLRETVHDPEVPRLLPTFRYRISAAWVSSVVWLYCTDKGINVVDCCPLPRSKPNQAPWGHHRCVHCHHVAAQTVQELTDALIQVWEEIHTSTHPPFHHQHAQMLHTQFKEAKHQPDTFWHDGFRKLVGSVHDLIFLLIPIQNHWECRPQWVKDLGSNWMFLHCFERNQTTKFKKSGLNFSSTYCLFKSSLCIIFFM